MEKTEKANQLNVANTTSVFGQTREATIGKTRGIGFLIGIGFLFVILILVLIYSSFFTTTKDFDAFETAVNLRGSAVELALNEEHKLDDFTSLFFAPNSIRFNTCSGETEVFNNEWSWTRDWIYLVLFDSLYAEFTGDDSYMADSQILLDSLYDQYSVPVGEDGRFMLENQDMVGFESYCLPYFILKTLDEDKTGNKSYENTIGLAQQLCEDFYDVPGIESFECEIGHPGCLVDEEFYSKSEKIFLVDEHELLEGQEPFFYPPYMITDDYVVAYGNELDMFVRSINAGLYKNIEYKRQTIELLRRYPDLDSCVENKSLYFGLLKALSIKRNFVTDEHLLPRHDQLKADVFSLCSTEYSDYDAVISNQITLGDSIEAYYLLEKDSLGINMEEMISDSLNKKVLTRSYMGEDFQFLKDAIPEKDGGFSICTDVEVNYAHNLKTSLYLLIYSIYGD